MIASRPNLTFEASLPSPSHDRRHAPESLQAATSPPHFSTRTPPRARRVTPPNDGPDGLAGAATRIAVAQFLYTQAQRLARSLPQGGTQLGLGPPPLPPHRHPSPPLPAQ